MKSFFQILLLVLLDQGTKYLFRGEGASSIPIFSFFELRGVENTGIAFSIPVAREWVILFGVGVLIFLGKYIFFHSLRGRTLVSAILVFSGALGNLIDRVFWGRVTDFFAFWNFPVFNLADVFITMGVLIFLFEEGGEKRKKNEAGG